MALSEKIKEINKLRKQNERLQPIPEEWKKKLWKKFRLEWNYNSNHIEGNTLTYGETELLLIFDKTTGGHDLREYEEMKGHDAAIQLVREWARDEERELNEVDIKDLNKLLLKEDFWGEAQTAEGKKTKILIKAGEYKEYPNHVRLQSGEIFEYAEPGDVPRLMGELMEWYRNNDLNHPLIIAAEMHYSFIRIHPFGDGNGRVARLLVNYILMKEGYPPIIVKSDDKKGYLGALNKADTGNMQAFYEYMAKQLIWSLQIANAYAEGKEPEAKDDLDKEIAVWKKQIDENKREDVIPKSDDKIYELYKSSLRPLFDLFLKKHEQFNDLFAETNHQSYVNNRGRTKDGIEYIDEKMIAYEMHQGQFLNEGENDIPLDTEFNSLSVSIEYRGFKKAGINAFDESTSIKITFEPFKYVVKLSDTPTKIVKLYSEEITKEEREELVTKNVKKFFENIKHRAAPKEK